MACLIPKKGCAVDVNIGNLFGLCALFQWEYFLFMACLFDLSGLCHFEYWGDICPKRILLRARFYHTPGVILTEQFDKSVRNIAQSDDIHYTLIKLIHFTFHDLKKNLLQRLNYRIKDKNSLKGGETQKSKPYGNTQNQRWTLFLVFFLGGGPDKSPWTLFVQPT